MCRTAVIPSYRGRHADIDAPTAVSGPGMGRPGGEQTGHEVRPLPCLNHGHDMFTEILTGRKHLMGLTLAFLAPALSLAAILGILRSAWAGGRAAALALVAGLLLGRAVLLGVIALGGFPPPAPALIGGPMALVLLGFTPLLPGRLRHPMLFLAFGMALGGLSLGAAFSGAIALRAFPATLAVSLVGMGLFFTLYARIFTRPGAVAHYRRHQRLWDVGLLLALISAALMAMAMNLGGLHA